MNIQMLINVATYLRCMQLYYHNCHNMTKGSSFVGDHKLLGNIYPELEGQYDATIERIMGLSDQPLNLVELNAKAALMLKNIPQQMSNDEMFKMGLSFEQELIKLCEQVDKGGFSSGTRQLIGDHANAAESRVYKLKQRTKQ